MWDGSPDTVFSLGTLLHVGCGVAPLPDWLGGCAETRLDIDPRCEPDVIGTMTDLGDIGRFDAVYTNHALEHLRPDDVEKALSEMLRVLKPGGTALIFVPDLEDVRPTNEIVYYSAAGPVTGLDMIYGMSRLVKDAPYMAHQTGFIQATLSEAMTKAGFAPSIVNRLGQWTLFAVGVKP